MRETRQERRRRIQGLSKSDSAQMAVVVLAFLAYGWRGAALAFVGQWAYAAATCVFSIWLAERQERRAEQKIRKLLGL